MFKAVIAFVSVCLFAGAFAVPAVGDDLECMACEFLVKEIESQLQANKTQSEIIAHLNAVCKKFGHMAGVCTSTVDKYAPELISMLANREPPATACGKVGACKNSTVVAAVKAGPTCAICELVVGEVDKLIQQNKTESEIISHLDDICKVTRVFKTECDKVVAEYVPEIIARLVAKEDPQFVCQHVHLCDSATFAKKALAAFKLATLRADNTTCEICGFVLGYAEKYVENHPNMTSSEVQAELEKLCKFLPANDSSKCDTIMTVFEPIVWAELKLGVAPQKICHDIHMCSTATKVASTATNAEEKKQSVVEDAEKVVEKAKAGAGLLKKLFGQRR